MQMLSKKVLIANSNFKGEVDKYGWVDTGSSFLPSELIAAFLYAQLEQLKEIQKKRKLLWTTYSDNLKPLEQKGLLNLPYLPSFATNNAHMFYVVTQDIKQRDALIAYLKQNGIHAVFHYLSLHKSSYYTKNNPTESNKQLPQSDKYTDCLIRLPFFYTLSVSEVNEISKVIIDFFK